ncbi:hypothetical protein ACFT1A_18645 [Rhodococcus sp. NPDC057135]|uniref:hypothetical protein n=1 Tax=Rhodococcus sp. NPDC057135 TaxID=3346028 RepID=UPI00362E2924
MDESFTADSSEIAGLSKLATQIGEDAGVGCRLVLHHTAPFGDFDGELMRLLSTPLQAYTDVTYRRYANLASGCATTGMHLNRAAWMYHDQEKRNYDALNAHSEMSIVDMSPYNSENPIPGPAVPYDSPAEFKPANAVDFPPPQSATDDIRKVIAESAGWVGDVDNGFKIVTGWSPLERLIAPLSGNWNELKRIGDAYKTGGDGIEKCGLNLEDGTKRVGESWDGLAAQSFDGYSRKLSEALKWEGPHGRVVKEVLYVLADQIRRGVESALRFLERKLDDQVQITDGTSAMKWVLRRVPYAGPSIITVELVSAAFSTAQKVQEIVDDIRVLVECLKEFLDLVTSPSGKLSEMSERLLAPVVDTLDDANKKTELGLSIAGVADAEGVLNTPKTGYNPGTGRDPWADAV